MADLLGNCRWCYRLAEETTGREVISASEGSFPVEHNECGRLMEALFEFYGEEDARLWLRSPHKLLNGERAIDLLGTDRAGEVWAVIDQLRSGAYA